MFDCILDKSEISSHLKKLVTARHTTYKSPEVYHFIQCLPPRSQNSSSQVTAEEKKAPRGRGTLALDAFFSVSVRTAAWGQGVLIQSVDSHLTVWTRLAPHRKLAVVLISSQKGGSPNSQSTWERGEKGWSWQSTETHLERLPEKALWHEGLFPSTGNGVASRPSCLLPALTRWVGGQCPRPVHCAALSVPW